MNTNAWLLNSGNASLTAPLVLPAGPGSLELKTQNGVVLDDGYGNLWPHASFLVGSSGNTRLIGAGSVTLSTNPPVSGTVYQNPNRQMVQLVIPATGGSTAGGTLQFALGSSSSPPNFGGAMTVPVSTTINFTTPLIPASWYWSVTTTGTVTIGTVSAIGY